MPLTGCGSPSGSARVLSQQSDVSGVYLEERNLVVGFRTRQATLDHRRQRI